ncbi:MAG: hypothetical protein ABIG20_02425 [archaeon]
MLSKNIIIIIAIVFIMAVMVFFDLYSVPLSVETETPEFVTIYSQDHVSLLTLQTVTLRNDFYFSKNYAPEAPLICFRDSTTGYVMNSYTVSFSKSKSADASPLYQGYIEVPRKGEATVYLKLNTNNLYSYSGHSTNLILNSDALSWNELLIVEGIKKTYNSCESLTKEQIKQAETIELVFDTSLERTNPNPIEDEIRYSCCTGSGTAIVTDGTLRTGCNEKYWMPSNNFKLCSVSGGEYCSKSDDEVLCCHNWCLEQEQEFSRPGANLYAYMCFCRD